MEENKFNFTEDDNKQSSVEESKEAVKKDARGLFQSIKVFFSNLLDFRDDTDREATIEAIKEDVAFKGATVWILVCSIMVASVGLNANSTAVVIGAMLISPLMGPILGAGMSLAINDIDTLKKSLINLTLMIVLSLLTAFLFFRFFPSGSQETSELLGRVRPDIRDVLIAFFGGSALIIARTKKGTIASVIFGVAIATALMPPLCTAGFGLANGNWNYFIGAMNLFTINTIFIAIATFIVLKVLRFPMIRYANSVKRRRISRFALAIAILVMIWPIITFIKVFKENEYKNEYLEYLNEEIYSNNDLWLKRERMDLDNKIVRLYFIGELPDAVETDLRNEFSKYKSISEFELDINADESKSSERLSQSLERAYKDLDEKETIIIGLQKQIESLREDLDKVSIQNNTIPFNNLSRNAKIKFSDLEYFGYAKMLVSSDFSSVDTINVASVKWNSSLNDSIITIRDRELISWLKTQVKADSIVLKKQ